MLHSVLGGPLARSDHAARSALDFAPDPSARDAVLTGRLHANRMADLLESNLGSESADYRAAAATALAMLDDPRAVPLLCIALEDPDPSVCLAAARALEQCADHRAFSALQTALAHCHRGDGSIGRHLTMLVLALLFGGSMVVCLLEYSRDPTWSGALCSLMPVFMVSGVIQMMRASSPLAHSLTRALARATEGGARVEGRSALPMLRRIARDHALEDPQTRRAAAELARRIAVETDSILTLPRPASSSAPPSESLPVPTHRRPKTP